jgi:hypothetical protein
MSGILTVGITISEFDDQLMGVNQMIKALRVAVLLDALVILAAFPLIAQVYQTGPAGLAQQMPRIYTPYMANISRVRILENRDKLNSPYRGGVSVPGGRVPSGRPPSDHSGTASSNQDTVFHSVEPAFVPRQLAALLGKTSQERRYIEEVLTKCLNNYTDVARQKGVPLHDVARAVNYYISTNYFVYSQGKGPTQTEMAATRDMVHANMAQDETFRRMSDRQKQEAYETLIVLAGFVDLGYGTAKQSGHESLAAPFRDMARQNLETLLGVPVEKMHFTNAGLEIN